MALKVERNTDIRLIPVGQTDIEGVIQIHPINTNYRKVVIGGSAFRYLQLDGGTPNTLGIAAGAWPYESDEKLDHRIRVQAASRYREALSRAEGKDPALNTLAEIRALEKYFSLAESE